MNSKVGQNPEASSDSERQDNQPEPKPAVVKLSTSNDNLELGVYLEKAGEITLPPVFEEVMATISEMGISFGINAGMLRALCKKPVYFERIVIAKGKAPKTGKDGYLRYLVETSRDFRPKMREDGTVDYRDIGFVQNVYKDQPLCELYPPEKGEDGRDIYGNPLEGLYGQEQKLPQGNNTVISEDGTKLLAACDGDVEVKKGVISVQDVLRIKGNVDNSTGDISFVGDVFVTGDVISGFKIVTTGGSITVRGSIEGARLWASEDITVSEGINGMGRGSVEAGGNIKCRYIQSCTIKAGGNIYADSIMYCELECGGNVELEGKRAALIGGRSAIACKLLAKTIGTDSHVPTVVVMASTGVEKEKELKELDYEIKRIDNETNKLVQILTRYSGLLEQGRLNNDQKAAIPVIKQQYDGLAARREAAMLRREEVKSEQLAASPENSYIECKERVHVGVQIIFGPLMMSVQNSFVYSRVSIIDSNITVSNLR